MEESEGVAARVEEAFSTRAACSPKLYLVQEYVDSLRRISDMHPPCSCRWRLQYRQVSTEELPLSSTRANAITLKATWCQGHYDLSISPNPNTSAQPRLGEKSWKWLHDKAPSSTRCSQPPALLRQLSSSAHTPSSPRLPNPQTPKLPHSRSGLAMEQTGPSQSDLVE